MKIRNMILWLILPILLLFGNCTTYEILNFDGYYFENNDDVLINNPGETYANPYVLLDDNTEIAFQLYTRSQIIKGNRYRRGGIYELNIHVTSKSSLKSIKNVTLNSVTIQAGDNEFNMLEKVNRVTILFQGEEKLISKYKRFSEEDMGTVRSSGLIDAETHRKKFDDIPENAITSWVSIYFNITPIDYTIYKEIFVRFDITVEYTTGETVRLDQEFYGLYEKRRIKIYRALFTA